MAAPPASAGSGAGRAAQARRVDHRCLHLLRADGAGAAGAGSGGGGAAQGLSRLLAARSGRSGCLHATTGARRVVRVCALRPWLAGGHRGLPASPPQHRFFASPPGRPRMGACARTPEPPTPTRTEFFIDTPHERSGRAVVGPVGAGPHSRSPWPWHAKAVLKRLRWLCSVAAREPGPENTGPATALPLQSSQVAQARTTATCRKPPITFSLRPPVTSP